MMKLGNEMSKREKSMIAVVAAIIAVAVLISVIALQSVLNTSAKDDLQRKTERIRVDEHTGIDDPIKADDPSGISEADPKPDHEENGDNIHVENNSIITSEKAMEIALSDAGAKESQVTLSRIRYEWDDGVQVYDIEFYYGGMEYEYEIEAKSGEIRDKEVDN